MLFDKIGFENDTLIKINAEFNKMLLILLPPEQ